MADNNNWGLEVLTALQKLANSASLTWEQAVTYAGLPAASSCSGSTWLVLQGTGVWPASKPSGWYYSDGDAWFYLGSYNPVTTGGNVVVSNFPSVQPVSFSGSVTVGNFPVVQPISGAVSVSNFPAFQAVTGTFWQATQPVSGPLTDAQLRASAVAVSGSFWQPTQPVSGTFWQATQPISGSVSVSNFPSSQAVTGTFWPVTQPVSGTFWQATQPISGAVSVSNFPASQAVTGTFWQVTQPISGSVSVSNFPASQAVTGTFWQATQPVSGPLTDVQLRATAVPVSGTFWQATQPVSGAFFQATQPVSGPLTDVQLRASAIPVSVPVLTKGAQGANGLTVQPLKDAGRTYVSFTANAVAGVTTEALVSFAQNKQGVNTAGVTSYTIPTGKTLRIISISVGLKSAAAAIAFAKVILRHNTAGATVVASPIAYLCPEINTNSALSGTGATITIPIPDGLEFFGNGSQTIGVSHLDQATTNILTITVHGFEY